MQGSQILSGSRLHNHTKLCSTSALQSKVLLQSYSAYSLKVLLVCGPILVKPVKLMSKILLPVDMSREKTLFEVDLFCSHLRAALRSP